LIRNELLIVLEAFFGAWFMRKASPHVELEEFNVSPTKNPF
jgi:hypothetical protein